MQQKTVINWEFMCPAVSHVAISNPMTPTQLKANQKKTPHMTELDKFPSTFDLVQLLLNYIDSNEITEFSKLLMA